MRKQFYICIFFGVLLLAFFSEPLHAQVANNSISKSVVLQTDAEPLYSTTDNATVEWECINKKLTERCLIYHNDQWFTFSPNRNGTLYLNISEQICKNKFGVQVLVIEGNPCETSSYKLLHCESFTNQSDTFIELKDLKVGTPYLINIDGFLADVCSFQIQVGTKPKGLPLKTVRLDTLQLQTTLEANVVSIQWEVTQQMLDSLHSFEAYKQEITAFKKQVLKQIPLRYTAAGHALTSYNFSDTLTQQGTYQYTILGVFHEGQKRIVLDEKSITLQKPKTLWGGRNFRAQIALTNKRKEDVDFLIMNAATGEVLFKRTCSACAAQLIEIDLESEIRRGIHHFWIETYHLNTKQQARYKFFVDQSGNLLQK